MATSRPRLVFSYTSVIAVVLAVLLAVAVVFLEVKVLHLQHAASERCEHYKNQMVKTDDGYVPVLTRVEHGACVVLENRPTPAPATPIPPPNGNKINPAAPSLVPNTVTPVPNYRAP